MGLVICLVDISILRGRDREKSGAQLYLPWELVELAAVPAPLLLEGLDEYISGIVVWWKMQ